MRTREDIREDLDKLTKAQNLLSKELKELDNKPEESTRLERLGFYDKGGDYHALDMDNSLCLFYRDQETGELTVGNSYKTEEDAQAAAKRREIMADLWSNSTPYYWRETCLIIYDHDMGEFVHQFEYEYQGLCPYFTEEKAKEMIDKWGDDLKLLNV